MTHKHCLRLNDKHEVIHAYSTGFEPYQEGDIILAETYERHFQFTVYTMDNLIKYRYENGELIEIDHATTRQKRDIMQELAALELVIPRWGEDTVDKGKLHKRYLDTIDRKNELRTRLKGML
jgi:hypothetical protein